MALIHLIGGKTYEETLKRRRLVLLAVLAVGILGLICYFTLVDGGDLPEFVQGFYFGGASGLTICAVILLIRIQYLLKNPAARKKAKIQDTDEREQTVIHKAMEIAGTVTFFLSAAILFVLVPVDLTAFWVVFGLVCVYTVGFLIAKAILQVKL